MSSGNKLPHYYDDPVDIFYKKYIDVLNQYFKEAGITPNMITTLSNIFGLLSCYLYYKSQYILASFSYLISYFFDTMDGYFARKYNMGTVFGSYYDSISDFVILLILFILFYKNNEIKTNIKLIAVGIIGLFVIGCAYQVSCQEKYVKKTNEKHVSEGLAFLDNVKCTNFENMKYGRFCGTGVTTLVVAIIIGLHTFLTKK